MSGKCLPNLVDLHVVLSAKRKWKERVFDHVILIKVKFIPPNLPLAIDDNCQKIVLIGLILREIFNLVGCLITG